MEPFTLWGGAILLGLAIVAAVLQTVFGKRSLADLLRRKNPAGQPTAPIEEPVAPPPPPPQRIEVSVAPPPAPASGEPTLWLGRPATMGDSFVGRNDDLVKLKQLLGEHQGTVLCGGPGTGKSRLAAELTYVRADRGFWANGAATAERTLGGLAVAFGIDVEGKDDTGVAAQVRQHLATEPPEALVVFDNVPDLAQINDLLNAAGGMRVLITSRDVREKIVPGHVGRHLVEVLNLASAVALLEAQAPGCAGDEALSGIAEAVGRLPLALMALGAALREGVRTPTELLKTLAAAPNPAELDAFTQALEGADLPHPAGVFAALTEGFERLSDDTRAAFSRLCYLADLPVPDGLARALTGIGDDTDGYGHWLDECQRDAVLIKEPGQVRIHALTAAAVRATAPDSALEAALTNAAARLGPLSQPDPASTRGEIAHHEALETHVERHFEAMHSGRLNLEQALGNAYHYLGRAAESIAVFEARTTRLEEGLGAEHRQTLGSRNNLASSHNAAGHTKEAIELHEANLPVLERVLGGEHEDTLASRINLAAAYQKAGRMGEAIALLEENLPVVERVLGAEHEGTLGSRNNLANAYQNTGRIGEAVALLQETLPIMERVLGAEHPLTLGSRHNLAGAYQDLGRTGEAIAVLQETLPVMERVLGREHPNTLISLNSLANAYETVGRTEEAINLHQETLRVRVRVLGADHADTLVSRSNLAIAYRASGRDADADRLMAEGDEGGKPG